MFAKVDKNLNSCESLGINKVNACSNWSARRRKTIVKFDSHGDWREDIFYNGRNGNKTEKRKRLCIPYQIVLLG
jgi:hypothetical protein